MAEAEVKLLATLGDYEDVVGRIVELDPLRETITPWLEWTPPVHLSVRSKGFTGAVWRGVPGHSDLYVCAAAALCRVDPNARAVTGVLHEPSMNDLHHVAVDGDRVLVSNTGADRIECFDHGARHRGGWDLAPLWVSAARFGGATPSRERWERAMSPGWGGVSGVLDQEPLDGAYYGSEDANAPFHVRRLRDFVHPNHIAIVAGRAYATFFLQRAILDLADLRIAVPETPGYPHDGAVEGDRFWITTTHGLIVAYAIVDGRVTAREVERLDLFELTGRSGWCRGLKLTPEYIFVGLTAIERMPRARWCDRPFEATETSVLVLDRRTRKLAARVDLSVVGKKPKLYSLLEAG